MDKKQEKKMSGYLVSDNRKVTTHRFIEMKERREKISMLTSYDFTTAGIVDGAGIDGILIGELSWYATCRSEAIRWTEKRA